VIIRVERSGGLTGIAKHAEIDTDAISKREAHKIMKMIPEYKFNQTYPKKVAKGAADYFNYSVSIIDDGHEKTLQFDQISIPQKIKEFINYILKNPHAVSKI
jgi:hypothetical protein